MLEGSERLGRIDGYATKFTPVISFHSRNWPCKMAGSPLRTSGAFVAGNASDGCVDYLAHLFSKEAV